MIAKTYSMTSPDSGFAANTVQRRQVEPHDVQISVEFCGLCHSDVHTVRSEWGQCNYPMAPGHEIVGAVSAIGDQVSNYAVGDKVGVGVMVDSCRECEFCLKGLQQYCEARVGTYNSKDYRHDDEITQGGYSSDIVVHEDYVLRIPEGMDLAATAPLLCAGITTYSPLRYFGVGPGTRVGVVGLGGLGHMAVKIAAAMGAEVTVFTRSADKAAEAKKLGAHRVIISKDEEQMAAAKNSLDLIINAVSAKHDLNDYLDILDVRGTMVLLGLPDTPHPNINHSFFIRKGIQLAGSLIGGIPETQEMLDFCAEHRITADIEMVNAEELDQAYDRMVAGDVKYRFVLDNSTL